MAKGMLDKKYWSGRRENRQGRLLGTDFRNRTTGLLVFSEEGSCLRHDQEGVLDGEDVTLKWAGGHVSVAQGRLKLGAESPLMVRRHHEGYHRD